MAGSAHTSSIGSPALALAAQDKPGSVLQYFHYNTLADFYMDKPSLHEDLWSNYDASGQNICQVFGGWDEEFKKVVATYPGVRFVCQPLIAGYIRPHGAGLEGPPIIFLSMRKVLPGKMEAYGTTMQAVADRWHATCPGLLGGCAYISDEDPDWVWDIRVMANWDNGYKGHAVPDLGPIWFANKDPAPFRGMPAAVAFSDYGKELVEASKGNAQYTHYMWNERIPGPLPNLIKGAAAPSYQAH